MPESEWKVSLHGGHSGEYCEHAQGTLRETVEAAVAWGYRIYGLSEHAPRPQPFLYNSEIDKGYDADRLESDFEAYASESLRLQREFDGRITLLRGFEAEVVPRQSYVERMLELRREFRFDFMVGSVHYVGGRAIDWTVEEFRIAVEEAGGLERLAQAYYRDVAEMVERLRPEVVGHLDLIRLHAPPQADLDTPAIRKSAEEALLAARSCGAVLDINAAGIRKGLATPYPAPWLLRIARRMGLGVCFGDDSHSPVQVGGEVEATRRYLLAQGFEEITALDWRDGSLVRRTISLL